MGTFRPVPELSVHGFLCCRGVDRNVVRVFREDYDQPMTEEDEKDYGRFLEGIEFFAKLDVPQTMEHIKQHKEDAFYSIRHFSGEGSAMCTKGRHGRLIVHHSAAC